MQEWFAKLANDFAQTFITKDRWQLFAKGFTVTIRVAILALLMGIAIGVLVAIVRTKHDSRKKNAHGFGNVILNTGAYVAEIVRGGIMSVDAGQMEAGRSLGMNYTQTMRHIIIPQAIKNILPALGNEMITLLKDTSLMTVIGAKDLTKAAQTVQAVTYQAFMPYISIAVIYLVCVIALSKLLALIERRMRNSDRR